uniref:Uncharacterized protein n=1 Tax=Rhizophora mucronata TaxID=61149 RepID=A0A2P2JMJ5_RHIMU
MVGRTTHVVSLHDLLLNFASKNSFVRTTLGVVAILLYSRPINVCFSDCAPII